MKDVFRKHGNRAKKLVVQCFSCKAKLCQHWAAPMLTCSYINGPAVTLVLSLREAAQRNHNCSFLVKILNDFVKVSLVF